MRMLNEKKEDKIVDSAREMELDLDESSPVGIEKMFRGKKAKDMGSLTPKATKKLMKYLEYGGSSVAEGDTEDLYNQLDYIFAKNAENYDMRDAANVDVDSDPEFLKSIEGVDDEYSKAYERFKKHRRLTKSGKKSKITGYTSSNMLIVGLPGGGKTSIIEQWADENDILLVKRTGSDMDEDSTKGVVVAGKRKDKYTGEETGERVAERLPTADWDELKSDGLKHVVLFVDEINRSWPQAEASLLTLVQGHDILFGDTRVKFNDLLFTIAAMNPPHKGRKVKEEIRELGEAMKNRFITFFWTPNIKESGEYWADQLSGLYSGQYYLYRTGKISEKDFKRRHKILSGDLDIVEALSDADDPIFTMEDREGGLVSSRSIWNALGACNGTFGTYYDMDSLPDKDDKEDISIRANEKSADTDSFLYYFIKTGQPTMNELADVIRAWEKYCGKKGKDVTDTDKSDPSDDLEDKPFELGAGDTFDPSSMRGASIYSMWTEWKRVFGKKYGVK